MKSKTAFIIILMSVVFLAISGVSASGIDEPIQNATDSIISTDNDDEEYYFYEFVDIVNSGGKKVVLEHDYISEYDSHIEEEDLDSWHIEKSVEIDGNNHVLDWNRCPNTLCIDADNVVVKNVVFKNFRNLKEYSTAIDWSGKNGLIENCTFTNNKFDSGLFMIFGESMVIKNCRFINNDGCTIVELNADNPTLTGCEFAENVVSDSGITLICSDVDNGIISNNIFHNNFYASAPNEICFDLISVVNDHTVKNNRFLNRGVILNNGIRITNWDLVPGAKMKFQVVGDDGNPVGRGKDVNMRFIINFYDENYYSDENPKIIKSYSFKYPIKTDSNGCFQIDPSILLNESMLSEKSLSYAFNSFSINSWAKFKSSEIPLDDQTSVASLEFEYDGVTAKMEYVNIKSSVVIVNPSSYYYQISSQPSIVDYGNYAKYTFHFYLIGSNSNAVSNKEFKIKIANNYYTIKTDKYGMAHKTVNLKYGTYSVSVKNPVTNQEITQNVKISKRLKNNKDVIKYYKGPASYKVRVYEDDGKVSKYDYVKITIGKTTKSIKVDKNGYVTFKLNQKPGKYTIKAQCGPHVVSNKVVIKSTIKTKNIAVKLKKSTGFKVKILNSKGKAFAKQAVKVKFNGKSYKLKTNAKGIAIFKVPNSLKVGKHIIKTTYNGYTVSNKITVKK